MVCYKISVTFLRKHQIFQCRYSMSPALPTPATTDSRDTLLEVAIQLIWQSHYANVGVNDICKQAGVTKGCFYHHFTSKAELFEAAANHYWNSIRQELDAIFSPTLPPLQQLESLIDFILQKQQRFASLHGRPVSGCPFFTSGAQAGIDKAKIRLASQEMSAKAVCYLTSLVRNLVANRLIASDMPAESLARLMHQLIQGILMHGQLTGNLEAVTQDIRSGLYRLLGLPTPSLSTSPT